MGRSRTAASGTPGKTPGDGNLSRLQDIDEQEQSDPDYIHEVPVPAGRLESKVIIRGEMTRTHRAQPLDQQHGHPHGDMETVEARQHKEG